MNQNLISFLKIAGAIATIALGAQITVNIGPIPITGQTLFILIWAFFLSVNESFIALTFYLCLGFIGLPIFADGGYGIDKLFGGSGGFLIGFVIAAVVVSRLNETHKSNSLLRVLTLTALGTVIIMFCGVVRLALLYGIKDGIAYGFLPFWHGAIVKIIIGSLIVWGIGSAIPRKQKV